MSLSWQEFEIEKNLDIWSKNYRKKLSIVTKCLYATGLMTWHTPNVIYLILRLHWYFWESFCDHKKQD